MLKKKKRNNKGICNNGIKLNLRAGQSQVRTTNWQCRLSSSIQQQEERPCEKVQPFKMTPPLWSRKPVGGSFFCSINANANEIFERKKKLKWARNCSIRKQFSPSLQVSLTSDGKDFDWVTRPVWIRSLTSQVSPPSKGRDISAAFWYSLLRACCQYAWS